MKPFITQTSDNTLNIDALAHKLFDADSHGFWAECLPSEAEAIGAFTEDALDLDDALAGVIDSPALSVIATR